MTIRVLRTTQGLTQAQAAAICQIPLRTYKLYETDANRVGTVKYRYICEKLEQHGRIDETHGILSLSQIENAVRTVLSEYDVSFCYLFGSYAKGTAKEESDVDLVICGNVGGLKFFGLAERLRESLQKKVDLLNMEQVERNPALFREILHDGVKIYAREE